MARVPAVGACLPAGRLRHRGFAINGLLLKAAVVSLTVICLVTQFQQARRATGRFASDERNPFAYVPTRSDVETLEPWLEQLRRVAPGGSLEPVAVVGVDYWPLPWYLRSFEKIGYWKTPTTGSRSTPARVRPAGNHGRRRATLEKSHIPLPRGLRADVPVHLFVRNDIWKNWMETDTR